jgi:predicted outer membrane repeat protein
MRTSLTVCTRLGAPVGHRPLALAMALALGATPLGSLAATISVTSTDDAGDPGTCTVRQAIASMNAGSVTGTNCASNGAFGTDDTINFDSTAFPSGVTNTITLADASTNTLQISDSILTIDASANGGVTIQRPVGATNNFGIINNSAAGSLTLNNLTLRNGNAGACGSDGSGICSSHANLTLNNSTLSGNSGAARGGGIFSQYGSLTLNNCTLSGNSATEGGGIHSFHSTVTLTNSTLSGNHASDTGGGIDGRSGNVTLNSSTLSTNTANFGGGIWANAAGITLTNSTLSGNSATLSGGGINLLSVGSLTLLNSTLTANTAGISGGGIYCTADPAGIGVINSILAGNNGGDINVTLTAASTGNIIGVNPLLGGLANNGGLTQTRLPLPGSPAIDAIACTNAPATDQRGVARPQGVQCDIGAVEIANPFTLTVDTTDDTVVVDGKCSLRQAVAIFTQGRSILDSYCPPSASPDNQILFASALAGSSIVLASQLNLDHNVAVTIDGSGAPGLGLDGSGATLLFNVASGSIVTIRDLQMVNGKGVGSDGGAITNAGTLTVTDSVFNNNHSSSGGAIRNSGTLNINHGTLSNNTASGLGGAIDMQGGVLTMADSSVTGNHASAGGGVFLAADATLNLTRSNVSTNHAFDTSGGGVAGNGHFLIGNSTFFGNTAAGDGGAIYSNKDSNTNILVNTTLSGNSATHGGNAANAAGTLLLRNSIVTSASAGSNCHGTITIGTGVLTWPANDTTCGAFGVADPMLGTLRDNGGPSFTMLPGPDSAAIDVGNNSTCASAPVNDLDQRGVVRPQGAACDLGAIEVVFSRIFANNFDGTPTP